MARNLSNTTISVTQVQVLKIITELYQPCKWPQGGEGVGKGEGGVDIGESRVIYTS